DLFIDPIVEYATYLGDNVLSSDPYLQNGMKVAQDGSVYLSADGTVAYLGTQTATPTQPRERDYDNTVLIKVNSDGSAIDFITVFVGVQFGARQVDFGPSDGLLYFLATGIDGVLPPQGGTPYYTMSPLLARLA